MPNASPLAVLGFVVTENSPPIPPVAKTVISASIQRIAPSSLLAKVPVTPPLISVRRLSALQPIIPVMCSAS